MRLRWRVLFLGVSSVTNPWWLIRCCDLELKKSVNSLLVDETEPTLFFDNTRQSTGSVANGPSAARLNGGSL